MKKKDIIIYFVLTIFTLIIFKPWLIGHYATDTYNIMNVGYKHYSVYNSLLDGRIFMFIIMQLAAFVNIKCEVLVTLILLLAILVSNFSVLMIKNIILEKFTNKSDRFIILSCLLAYLFIYNFMYIENLYFLEGLVMAISILLDILAAKIYFDKAKNYKLKTILLLLFSVFCYQGTISTFIVFTAFLLLINKCHIKECLTKLLEAITFVAISCIFNFIFIKIISSILNIEQIRLSSNILKNVFNIIFTKIVDLIYTSNNFYPFFFLGFFVVMGLICIIINSNFREILKKIFLILVIVFCVNLPNVVTDSAFWAGRTRFGIGALFSIIAIYALIEVEKCDKSDRFKYIFKKLISGIVIIYFMVNTVNYVDILINTKVTNACEEEYVKELEKYIIEYEKSNDVKIEKIQLVYDITDYIEYYDLCTRRNNMTWNALACKWSAVGAINFYTNRNLTLHSSNYIEMDMNNMYEIIDDVLYFKFCVL